MFVGDKRLGYIAFTMATTKSYKYYSILWLLSFRFFVLAAKDMVLNLLDYRAIRQPES